MGSFPARRKSFTKPFRRMRIASEMATDRPVRLRAVTRSPFSATTITTLRNTPVIPTSVTTTREIILRSTTGIPRCLGVVLSFLLTTSSVSLIQRESVLRMQKETSSHTRRESISPIQREITLVIQREITSLTQRESILLIQREITPRTQRESISLIQREITPLTQRETTLLPSTPTTASVAPARAASAPRGRTRARRRSRGA